MSEKKKGDHWKSYQAEAENGKLIAAMREGMVPVLEEVMNVKVNSVEQFGPFLNMIFNRIEFNKRIIIDGDKDGISPIE